MAPGMVRRLCSAVTLPGDVLIEQQGHGPTDNRMVRQNQPCFRRRHRVGQTTHLGRAGGLFHV